MSDQILNNPLQYAKLHQIEFDGSTCCYDCIQAMIEIVMPFPRFDYSESKTEELCLPPAYSNENDKKEYMAVFCKVKHRNINYIVQSCSDYMSLDMVKKMEEEENG